MLFPWKELVLMLAHHEYVICCIFSVVKLWVQHMESRNDWMHGMDGCTSHQKVIVWVKQWWTKHGNVRAAYSNGH